ncbi:hypothetical protein SAMN02983003_1020 [Devosia enhydra]|uniref:Uncharacterized protein n=1 Tax=Devosia enhydra TaxID=665118 RepID=A0A1K2HWE0_9HYPH|nr:hypothetical protein [Devosia enhydra]SFZ82338.1 hypothetical protein SAMN02983003_1020 [Devosia enhydra]
MRAMHSSGRRRFLAALSAVGVGAIAGLRPARAESAPCQISYNLGTEFNGEPNYLIEADKAQFTFLTPIAALGEEIVLYDGTWTEGRKSAQAAIKGELVRFENGTIGISTIALAFPITALLRDGNLYGVVQIAHDQDALIGLQLTSGDTSIGGFAFAKGSFDPNTTAQGFSGNAALTIYQALRSDLPFKAELMSGGVAYSAITVDTPSFTAFVDETVIAGMERMRERDATTPCAPSLNDIIFDDPDISCFLTTACCAVVGLRDDCWELQSLRRLRDGWMSGFAEGRADIARYYTEAPAVARRLMGSEAGRRQLLGLYWRVIVPAAALSRMGLNGPAYRLYRRMMRQLLPASVAA